MFFKADDFLSLLLFPHNLLAVGINIESMGVLESCQRKAISPNFFKKKKKKGGVPRIPRDAAAPSRADTLLTEEDVLYKGKPWD